MSADAARQPVAQGSLFDTPLCHIALYLNRHGQNGTLVVRGHERGDALIRVQRGRPTAARLPWTAPGLLDALLPLCALAQGEFAFFEDDLIGEDPEALGGIVDPFELLAASLDGHVRDDMVDAVLARFAGRTLRMLPGRELDRLRLRAEHGPLLELIRAAPATADELIAQAPLPAPQVRKLLYALIATNVVGAHDQRDGETFRSGVEPASNRPASSSSLPAARPAAPSGSPPGAPPAMRSGRPGAAWQQLASLRPGGMSLQPGGASLPARSAQPPASAQSQVSLRPTSLVPEGEDKPARIKRSELLLQRGRIDDALANVDAMLATEPYDAELLALRAHVLFEKHQVNPDGLPRAVLDAIRRALEADPEHPRALYTKGLVFKRAGDAKKALVYFRRVLQVEPKHLEAQREVRLAKLRQ